MQETHSWLNNHLHLNDSRPLKDTKLRKNINISLLSSDMSDF